MLPVLPVDLQVLGHWYPRHICEHTPSANGATLNVAIGYEYLSVLVHQQQFLFVFFSFISFLFRVLIESYCAWYYSDSILRVFAAIPAGFMRDSCQFTNNTGSFYAVSTLRIYTTSTPSTKVSTLNTPGLLRVGPYPVGDQ